jgi:O-antigen/teichoic acid export membrane protein
MMGIFFISYIQVQRSEIFFLGRYQSTEVVSFYSIASLLAQNSLGLVLQVFSGVLVPAFSEQFARGDISRIKKIYLVSARYLMALGIPLAIGGMALAGPIIRLFYGVDYLPAVLLLQIVLIPYALLAIDDAATGVLYGMDQPAPILKVGIIMSILSIGLDLWLIPRYGAVGAAISSSTPRFISAIIIIIYASRMCQTPWPLKDTFKISVTSIVMGVIIYTLQHFIRNAMLSLVLLLPLGVVVHIIGLAVLGVIRQDDINIMKQVGGGLPTRFRGIYGSIVRLIEKMTRKPVLPINKSN